MSPAPQAGFVLDLLPPRRTRAMALAAWVVGGCLIALLAGALAASGAGAAEFALACLAGLVAAGAALPVGATRLIVLGALLLVPDAPSGASLGLLVRWSAGLTWSNFIVPGLAVPLLFGAFLVGNRLLPRPLPGLARWCFLLLAWCVLTLLAPWWSGALNPAEAATLLAHLVKLALFIWLGVVVVGDSRAPGRVPFGQAGRDRPRNSAARPVRTTPRVGLGPAPGDVAAAPLEPMLLAGVAVNALVGLAQAAHWLPVFSPLAQPEPGVAVRVTGLFYDANMYGVLAAWALLWLLCRGEAQPAAGARRYLGPILVLAVAANLVGTGSRAAYLALGVGCLVLLAFGHWRPVRNTALVLVLLGAMFPIASWQRIASAVETVQGDISAGDVAVPGGDAGTQERLQSMAEAWRQIAAHPLLGLGFGRALYLGVPALGGDGPVRPVLASRFNGAQSMAVTVLAETGPIGLALFLLAIGAPWRSLRPRLRTGDLARLAGFAGLLAACFTIEALWNTRLLALVVVLTTSAWDAAPAGAPGGAR